MQVVENWSRVTGRVVSWTPPPDEAGAGELVVEVSRVEPVPRGGGQCWPNLLGNAVGRALRVRVPPSAAASLRAAPGAGIALDVRRGRDPDLVFANGETIAFGPTP